MSLTNRACHGDMRARSGSLVIAANATTAIDFGTPNDIDLSDGASYEPGDRVVILLTALRAAGSTSTLSFTVQDADDDDGAIGTPATATLIGTAPSFAAGDSGMKSGLVSVRVKPGRPWIRVNAVHGTAGTDSFQVHATVLGIPNGI